MNNANNIILVELGRTGDARSLRDLVALCELKQAAVQRALGELAADGAVERLLVEQSGHLKALWRKRSPRSRAARDDEALA